MYSFKHTVHSYIYTIVSMYLFSLAYQKRSVSAMRGSWSLHVSTKGYWPNATTPLGDDLPWLVSMVFWEEEQLRATISKNKHIIIWHHRKRWGIRSSFSKRTFCTFIYITSHEGDALGSLKILWSVWLGEICRHFHPVVMTCRNAGVMRP